MRLYTTKSVDAACEIIETSFASTNTEQVDLLSAFGMVLATDIIATENIPAFSRSTVDGYGVMAQDTFGASQGIPAFLDLKPGIEIGTEADALSPNCGVYVPTGGMIPEGASGVVMIEDTEVFDNLLNIYKQIAPGENIIAVGEDVMSGDIVLQKGTRLKSAEIGVLASLGIDMVNVYAKPKVAVLSTGDELLPWDTVDLPNGKIRDCNAPAIISLCQEYNAAGCYGGIVSDNYDMLKTKALSLLAANDMLVLSGGSSVGMRDFTTRLLKELGGDKLLLEGIALQPGKPTLLSSYMGKPILGLPGHPVSAINVFNIVGQKLLQQLSGQRPKNLPKPTVIGVLTQNIPSQPGRMDVVRVSLSYNPESELLVTPVLGRSGLLKSLRQADGVIIIPETAEGLNNGCQVQVHLF